MLQCIASVNMLIFCTVVTFVNIFWLIKKELECLTWRTQPVLFPVFQGHIFPLNKTLPEVSNNHFEFFDAFTQGYEEVSQKFTSIRRVRGDNYCALRATLFQAMSQPAGLPSWLQDPELTLVRCCCRFASVMFPIVSVRKTSLFCLCSVLAQPAIWRQHVGSLGFVWLGWFCIVKATKNSISQKRKMIKFIWTVELN